MLRAGSSSLRVRPRTVVVCVLLMLLLLAVGWGALAHGRSDLGVGRILAALGGDGEASLVRSIRGRRLPRLLTGAGVGGLLGVSGAIFQSISRNVLGSPDVIGFTSGAATAAVLSIVTVGAGGMITGAAAIAGGLATAVLVYALARRDGVSGGLRLVLVGVGTGALLSSLTDAVLVRASVADAGTIQRWTQGSLTGRGAEDALFVLVVAVVCLPVTALVVRRLNVMEMGDQAAAGLGIATERYRFVAVLLGVVLVGAATAVSGPIAFVALAAPQIAKRLVRAPGVPVATSFLVGATLLAGADLLSQVLEVGLRTPVGLVTSLLGGVYLIWLLARRV